ncbi:MAG: tetratricopeptide repeat protein [Clostridiaceae bacterium]|nr:tetratricopeptide repeat protein [Clostridiaceae bacterium]
MVGSALRVILPFLILYFAFKYLGTLGGIAVVVLFILGMVWFNRSIVYQNSANAKYHKGDFDGALQDLKKAVEIAPKAAKLRGSLAYLLLKLGFTDEAAFQIDKALDCADNENDRYALRQTKAMVLWKQGKIDEAIEDLEKLLEQYEHTNVYATLGFLYIEKGDMQKALDFNLKAMDYNSSNAIILDNLGSTYIKLGEYDKANEIYQNVMKLKPVFPEAYYNYAHVLEHTGDLEKALYMVRHALSLRFWNVSTVTRDEVEAYQKELEAKVESQNADTRESNENTVDEQ